MQNVNQYTCLMLVILLLTESGTAQAMRILVKRTFSTNRLTFSPKQCALDQKLKETKGKCLLQKELDEQLLLSAYTHQPDLGVLTELLESGADANAHDDTGATALHIAAYVGNAEVANLFLKHGANPNAECTNVIAGPTPLHHATYRAQVPKAAIITALIEAGANKKARSLDTGDTPLLQAMLHQGPAEVLALLTTLKAHCKERDLLPSLEQKLAYELKELDALLMMANNARVTPFNEAMRRKRFDIAALVHPSNSIQHRQALIDSIVGLKAEDLKYGA